MARDIGTIQRDIAISRDRLRTTAEAIGHKADVTARAKDLMREARSVLNSRHGASTGGDGGPGIGGRIQGVRERVGQMAEAATGTVSSATDTATGMVSRAKDSAAESAAGQAAAVSERLPSRGDISDGSRRIARAAAANPMPLAMAGLLAGVGAALMLPATRIERERVAPIANDMADRGARMGADAVAKAGERIEEALPA